MSQNHPTDLLPALALGCLDKGESEAVHAHLADCKDCRKVLESFQEVTHSLAHGAPSASPQDVLKKRLFKRIRSKPKTFGWFEKWMGTHPHLTAMAAFASILLVIFLGVSNMMLWQRMAVGKNLFQRIELVYLEATPSAPVASGMMIIDPAGNKGLLTVKALNPLTPEKQYQLWLIRSGMRTSGGIFSVTKEEGWARLPVVGDHSLLHFDTFGITIEPYGGSPNPTGQKVLGGKISI